MSCSPRSGVHCPRCGMAISLSLAAQLQSEQLGVACDCPECEHQWVYRIDSGSSEEIGKPVSSSLHRMSKSAAEPTIFIVDDDEAVRDALDGLMRINGWQTRLFSSAEEFQERCRPTRPGCLLLDVYLPGMSGLELLRELHQADYPLPVILMTESLEEHVLRRTQNAGAFAFFSKPFNVKALMAGIRSALEQSVLEPPDQIQSTFSDTADRSVLS